METRRFGASDLSTTVIGYGTWPIGGVRYGPSDDAQAIAAIHAALDLGITCFDTAPNYGVGHAEEVLGRALAGRRDRVVLVTKGGLIWQPDGQVVGRNSRREHLEAQLEESLRRLRTDWVDLYLIHWPDLSCPFEVAMESLAALLRSGKTRYIGVSNFGSAQLRECAVALGDTRLVANQVAYSMFDRRWERETFPTCAELGIGVMAYGPLAHGLLAGAITRDTVFAADDWRAAGTIFGQPLLTPENLPRNLEVVERLKSLASQRGITLPQLAIAWVLRNPVVTVALVGARNPAEIAESAAAAQVELTDEDMAEIEEIIQDVAGRTDELPA